MMSKQIIVSTFFSILASLCVLDAQAGTVAGGGGKGVVCRNPDGSIRSAELLDLWEARELHQLEIQPVQGNLAKEVYRLADSMGPSLFSDDIDIYMTSEGKNSKPETVKYSGPAAISQLIKLSANPFLNPNATSVRRLHGVDLTLTDDSKEAIMPRECAIEQIVHYVDYFKAHGSILINQDIVDRLDLTNQVALILHEALYKRLRDYWGEENSLRVRRTIGLAMSGHKFGSLNKTNLPSRYYECAPSKSPGTTPIFLYELPQSRDYDPTRTTVILQAARLHGLPVIDGSVITKLPENGASMIRDFEDLSDMRNHRFEVETGGIVQPELRTEATVTRATKRKFQLLLNIRKSIFREQAPEPIKLTCIFKTK